MLRSIRKAGQGPVGKVLATLLFVLLIGSFAIWGIGDIFRGAPPNTVARVGETDINIDQFRRAYQNTLDGLRRQLGRTITPEQARSFGIDQQVLGELVTEAVLSQRAKSLGLSASDDLVRRSIFADPAFHDPSGQFSRLLLDERLRDSGLSEAGFVDLQRQAITRSQLADGLAGETPVPMAAREAVHRYTAERRAASYFVLPPSAAGDISNATAEQLQAFYDERKASFAAPEYRALAVVALDAAAIAKPDDVSDADARQRYEQVKARFGTPERRMIEQIVFASPEEAQAAANRITEGTAFEAIATEKGIAAADLSLGNLTRTEMLDAAVAEAAFALQEGTVSAPVNGSFGSVLVRVTQVQPESVRSFEEVAPEIKREIALERARSRIDAIYDEVEDMRASARPLAEIAREKGLNLITIPAVDRAGLDKAGNAVADLPEREALLQAAFASDIGVDNEALRARSGGYVWFDVTGIEPRRERTLDEVRAEVERQWRAAETDRRLADKARAMVERLDKGDAIEAVASEAGAEVRSAADLARRSPSGDLSAEAVGRVFATPVAKAGSAPAGADSRAVFKVTAATVPPFVTTTQEAERIEDTLRRAYGEDILAEYIAQARKEMEVTINPLALRQVVGGEI